MKPLTARAVPLCQVETCQKPLVYGRRDCAAMLKKKP